MSRSAPILTPDDWERYAAPSVDPALWTAVVPAAGRGSRLGFAKPKILYPVAGRTILEWLLDFLLPCCRRVVLVLSPDGRAIVEAEVERIAPGRCGVAVQETPTGMGDAVCAGLSGVDTEHAAIVWGDQVALRRASVEACLRVHQGPLSPDLTCPTLIRRDPYIHLERDGTGRITGLLQKREGDAMPAEGESDTGFFCFRTSSLRRLLDRLRSMPEARGAGTHEFNFLPVIPLAAREGVVVSPRVVSMEETIGVNSREDAAVAEAFLNRA